MVNAFTQVLRALHTAMHIYWILIHLTIVPTLQSSPSHLVHIHTPQASIFTQAKINREISYTMPIAGSS